MVRLNFSEHMFKSEQLAIIDNYIKEMNNPEFTQDLLKQREEIEARPKSDMELETEYLERM